MEENNKNLNIEDVEIEGVNTDMIGGIMMNLGAEFIKLVHMTNQVISETPVDDNGNISIDNETLMTIGTGISDLITINDIVTDSEDICDCSDDDIKYYHCCNDCDGCENSDNCAEYEDPDADSLLEEYEDPDVDSLLEDYEDANTVEEYEEQAEQVWYNNKLWQNVHRYNNLKEMVNMFSNLEITDIEPLDDDHVMLRMSKDNMVTIKRIIDDHPEFHYINEEKEGI